MKEIHYFYIPDAARRDDLPEEEARHAVKVLRLGVGDRLAITDGKGHFYDAEVTAAGARSCSYRITGTRQAGSSWSGHLHLALAPTKNIDRTEWFVEKACEIGIDEISFVDCRCSERHTVKPERIERIVVAAMKQSHKAVKPIVSPMVPLTEFLRRPDLGEEKYIAHCLNGETCSSVPAAVSASSPRCWLPGVMGCGSKTILIGPEGDFAVEEVDMAARCGFVPVSLGESRLRTETAALYAVMLMNLKNSNLQRTLK